MPRTSPVPSKIAFAGVDLGWYGKPSGVALIRLEAGHLKLASVDRVQGNDAVLAWLSSTMGGADGVVAVDAPLVIRQQTGIRDAERLLNADYRRFHAGCHAANLSRPFAQNVIAFSAALEKLGFAHGADLKAQQPGRFQIEVHPHAATVDLFDLPQIVKYKRGVRADRARELRRLRSLIAERMPALNPPFEPGQLPAIPRAGNLKPVEDCLDAILCAYIAAHYWWRGKEANRVYGAAESGYIVVPSTRVHR